MAQNEEGVSGELNNDDVTSFSGKRICDEDCPKGDGTCKIRGEDAYGTHHGPHVCGTCQHQWA